MEDPNSQKEYKKLKTSEQWYNSQNKYKMLDPDGWDRKNFRYSWYNEKITKEAYDRRVMYSTIEWNG